MGPIFSANNQQILHPVEETHICNCRVKTDCPIQNKSLTPQVVYEAEVTKSTGDKLKIYHGLTKTTFKEKHRNHKTWKTVNCQNIYGL